MADETKITEERGRLILERSLRDGSLGVFLLVWLTGWTYGVMIIGKDFLAAPTLGHGWPLLLTAGVEAVMLVVAAFAWAGRELVYIDGQGVEWEKRAILRFRHRVIRLQDVESVDLVPFNPTPKDSDWAIGVLEFAGAGQKIHFGKGLDGAELHSLLTRVRTHIDQQRPMALVPPALAPQITPINRTAWEEQWRQAHPATVPEKAGGWLAVLFFVVIGCIAVVTGVTWLRKGTLLAIVFGIVFTGVGLLFSVGLTCASVSVFRDWLRNRK